MLEQLYEDGPWLVNCTGQDLECFAESSRWMLFQEENSKLPFLFLQSNAANTFQYYRVLWTYSQRSFAYAAPKLWNHLPTHVGNAISIGMFKSSLQTNLISMWLSLASVFTFIFWNVVMHCFVYNVKFQNCLCSSRKFQTCTAHLPWMECTFQRFIIMINPYPDLKNLPN